MDVNLPNNKAAEESEHVHTYMHIFSFYKVKIK